MLRDHPHMAGSQPFEYVRSNTVNDPPLINVCMPSSIKVKEISFSYHVEKVFSVDIPALQHGNDGLIYTCVSTPYTPGSDRNMYDHPIERYNSILIQFALYLRLKWKPPSENSIDFKLVLRFPPSPSKPSKPDLLAKPLFMLHTWCGDVDGISKYEEYDDMYVDDTEWEK